MTATSAVVIGASGGIGQALTQAIVLRGRHARVHALSRSAAAAPIPGTVPGRLDLEDEPSISAAASQLAQGPRPELVLIASGVLHGGFEPERSYRALDPAHLLRDFTVNAAGPALVAKHFLPLMARDRPGVFGVLSARVGSIGDNRLGGWHSYRASKAALNMILKNLAIELARTHPQLIIVGLHPGTVDTALSAPFQKGVAPEKLFDPAYSAARLLAVLDGLGPTDSGGVFDWDGQKIVP